MVKGKLPSNTTIRSAQQDIEGPDTVTVEGTLMTEGRAQWLIDFGSGGLGEGIWIGKDTFEVIEEDGDSLVIELDRGVALEKGII